MLPATYLLAVPFSVAYSSSSAPSLPPPAPSCPLLSLPVPFLPRLLSIAGGFLYIFRLYVSACFQAVSARAALALQGSMGFFFSPLAPSLSAALWDASGGAASFLGLGMDL